MTELTDKDFMEQALAQAGQALEAGEFPVGCVIADGRRVLATGARRGSAGEQPNELDHAEMVALRKLYTAGGFERKTGPLTLYCTMEPCLMCFGAIVLNRIPRIVY
ncbi:MAG: nucleoside deaminase, partial [Thermodesulfobacteriota bacterium]